MGWREVLGALWRRRLVILSGLLLTSGLAYAGWTIVPPTYQAEGTILLLPSKSTVSQGGHNPFLNLDSLSAPAALVIARLDGETERSRLKEIAPTADYTVETDPTMRGPTILVTVSDRTATSTLTALNNMLDTATEILQDIQVEQNVPTDAAIGSMRLTVDTKATRSSSDTIRAVVAIIVAGVVVTVVSAVTIDAGLNRRRVRRNRPVQDEGSPEPVVPDDDLEELVTPHLSESGPRLARTDF